MPMKFPLVGMACWFADSVKSPLATAMLDPADKLILREVVNETPPAPLVVISLVAFGRLIVPATKAARLLSLASVTTPLTVKVLNGLAAAPIVRPAVKSGRPLMVNVSPAFPRLIVTDPVGLAKSVVSNVPFPLRSRDMPLLDVPSSSRITVLAAAGKLTITSAAEPVFEIGSRPVKRTWPKLLIVTLPSLALV